MHIIHIASELAPIAKIGGLGDVVLGLSRELSWKGHDVDIIIPKYDCMDSNEIRDMTIEYADLKSFYNGEWHNNTVWMGWVENLKVYFIDPHHPRHFFHRGCIYGCDDDTERYLYFCRAAMEFIYKKGLRPDVIHTHDWQAAVIPALQADIYKGLGLNKTKTVFTIHNIEYQGKCSPMDLDRIGLKGSNYKVPGKMLDQNNSGVINLVKGAIVYSDWVTTVSPNYAKEILTPEGGRGLDKILSEHQNKVSGILNGVDYSFWNPEIDRYLPAHYSSREMPANKKDRNTLDKKAYIKKILRDKLMLDEQHRPILGCVARLVPQKGLELIKHALFRTLEKEGQFVLLGSSPIPSINAEFHELNRHFSDHPHVSLILQHQEELAHLIYAGSDMFIVPSLFEPCGLTQLIALKYGSVPIVRKTGGLADTIFDIDYSEAPIEQRNGYAFDHPDHAGVNSALDRAFKCWYENPDKWRKIMVTGMDQDFSWNKPASDYVEIYKQIALK